VGSPLTDPPLKVSPPMLVSIMLSNTFGLIGNTPRVFKNFFRSKITQACIAMTAAIYIIRASRNSNFLENCKILAENNEKIIQFSFENHRKSV
jgi:hypothetical protein